MTTQTDILEVVQPLTPPESIGQMTEFWCRHAMKHLPGDHPWKDRSLPQGKAFFARCGEFGIAEEVDDCGWSFKQTFPNFK